MVNATLHSQTLSCHKIPKHKVEQHTAFVHLNVSMSVCASVDGFLNWVPWFVTPYCKIDTYITSDSKLRSFGKSPILDCKCQMVFGTTFLSVFLGFDPQ